MNPFQLSTEQLLCLMAASMYPRLHAEASSCKEIAEEAKYLFDAVYALGVKEETSNEQDAKTSA